MLAADPPAILHSMEAPAEGAIIFKTSIILLNRRLTLGDVADLSRLPVSWRDRAARVTLGDLKPRPTELAIPVRYLAERARAAMPGLAPWLPAPAHGTVFVRQSAQSAQPDSASYGGGGCMRAVHSIAVGEFPRAADLTLVECGLSRPALAFRYDGRAGAARAVRTVAPDDIVPALGQSFLAKVRPGDVVALAVGVGAVRIERTVKALQTAPLGRGFFVRADDGAVFAVPGPAS